MKARVKAHTVPECRGNSTGKFRKGAPACAGKRKHPVDVRVPAHDQKRSGKTGRFVK